MKHGPGVQVMPLQGSTHSPSWQTPLETPEHDEPSDLACCVHWLPWQDAVKHELSGSQVRSSHCSTQFPEPSQTRSVPHVVLAGDGG